ncbi:hypothetical protein QBE55_01630 [Eubacteriales bacterium mix99]
MASDMASVPVALGTVAASVALGTAAASVALGTVAASVAPDTVATSVAPGTVAASVAPDTALGGWDPGTASAASAFPSYRKHRCCHTLHTRGNLHTMGLDFPGNWDNHSMPYSLNLLK